MAMFSLAVVFEYNAESPTAIFLEPEVFEKRAALVPEFAKIICVTVAFVLDNGDIKKQSFSGKDEYDVLKEVQKLLDRCGKLDFYL